MGGAIVIFLLAIVLFITANSMRGPSANSRDAYPATGTIEKIIFTDAGNAYYYVAFTADGKTYSGQSITYSSTTKTLNDGDHVQIRYYFTKSGRARVIIDDERLVPCEASLISGLNVLKVISVALALIALALFITKIL